MFVTGLAVALIDTSIPVFIGRLVGLMQTSDRAGRVPRRAADARRHGAARPDRPAARASSPTAWSATTRSFPGATSLIRWQSHWHVVRQSWPFFQNDFAGRIANRVMQTGNAVRECVVSSIRAIWYIAIYGISALVLMAFADWRLAVPTALWFGGLRALPAPTSCRACATCRRPRRRCARTSWAAIVDSYTNILTVKLFARARDEDAYVREVIDEHTGAIAAHMRLITRFMLTLSAMNALLLVATAAIGIVLWSHGAVGAGIVATALPLAWQIANVAGWVSWEVTGIFENIGIVQEGMETIAVPHTLVDRPARASSRCRAARSASSTSPSPTAAPTADACSTT